MKLPTSVDFSVMYSYLIICGALGLSEYGAYQGLCIVWMFMGGGLDVGGGGKKVENQSPQADHVLFPTPTYPGCVLPPIAQVLAHRPLRNSETRRIRRRFGVTDGHFGSLGSAG